MAIKQGSTETEYFYNIFTQVIRIVINIKFIQQSYKTDTVYIKIYI